MPKSRSASSQIPLVLPLEPSISRDDLLESSANQLAVDLVDRWPDWPSNMVVLAGPVGSGKTHLARVWANRADAEITALADLENTAREGDPGNLVFEDAEAGSIDEEALFHAINRARSAGRNILITSRTFPQSWNIALPDLVSRLKLAHLVELQEPDDALLSGIIFKLFADRQIEVSPAVVEYLVTRMERSMEVACKVVNWLDHEALARHRKVNRALAGEALAALGLV